MMRDHPDIPPIPNHSELPHIYDAISNEENGTQPQRQVTTPHGISGQVTNHGTIHGPVIGANTGIIIYHSLQPRAEIEPKIWQPRLAAMPLDAVPVIATLPSGSRMPYAPNPHFVGRDEMLLALAQTLKGGGVITIGLRAAATGLGGIGKTSVAAEFVHRYGQYFAGGVFWLSFADPAAVPGEVAACGGSGFLALNPTFGDMKLDEQIDLVKASWRQDIPRLLIFDNCDDHQLVQRWIPPTGGIRVLITSRRSSWPPSLGIAVLILDVLPHEVSVDLLRQLAPHLTTDEAGSIAEELGYLPLALHLAGSYLAQFHRTSVVTYLAELTSDMILKHPSLRGMHDVDISPTAHDRHVGRTFLVSYRRMDVTLPRDVLALRLLVRAAYMAPSESIPLSLLLATVYMAYDDRVGQLALQRLIDLGMVTAGADFVYLHRLVHAFVQALALDAAALDAVEEALDDQVSAINAAGYPGAMQPLLAHLRWATRQIGTREDPGVAILGINLANHLKSIGDYGAARPLYERLLAITEHELGPIHPATATSLGNLAGLLKAIGDYAAARPLYERALAIKEQVMGPTHPATATSLGNLAGLLESTGEYAAARPLYERALAITEHELGPIHPDTATSLGNLAGLLESMGEYAAARPLYERALVITEQALGPTHPATATDLNNLASLLTSMGEYAAARPLYERALVITEQALGPTHPDTAISLGNLAYVLYDARDYGGARPLQERALTIDETALGPNHPNTATSLGNLASLLESTGEYTAARPLYERALAIREQALGPTHPDTASSVHNLALLLQAIGEYGVAWSLFARALVIREQTLGDTHPSTKLSRARLAALNLKLVWRGCWALIFIFGVPCILYFYAGESCSVIITVVFGLFALLSFGRRKI